MKLQNMLIGSGLFIAYNFCCLQYIKKKRMERNKRYKIN